MPAAPAALRVRVGDLLRHPGDREHLRREVVVSGEVGDVALDGSPVLLEGDLESVSGGVRAVGVVRFGWVGSCRRCLGEARGEAEASFEELFADAGSAPAAGEDLPEVHEGWIDLEPVVRDTVLLGLPLAPVCRPDCPGPAPVEFPVVLEDDLEDDRAGADAPEGRGPDPDPRWAPLAGLRFDPEDDHPLP